MKVGILHTTRLDYSSWILEGVTEARLGPRSDPHQHWQSFDLRAAPSASVNQFVDGFGNTTHLVTVAGSHAFMEIVARSNVETLLEDPFRLPDTPIRQLTAAERADYMAPSELVPANADLAFLAEPFAPPAEDGAFAAVHAMMELVYREFEYASQVTTVATTVAEVLAQRRGVCQDFTHVLIGLCRSIGIAARYVSGYIVAGSQRDRLTRGAEASHAWVEAFTPTHG